LTGESILKRDHNFAKVLTLFQILKSSLSLLESKFGINHGVGKDSDEKGPFYDFRLFPIAETRIVWLRSPFF
jgi:hypothetical protein